MFILYLVPDSILKWAKKDIFEYLGSWKKKNKPEEPFVGFKSRPCNDAET